MVNVFKQLEDGAMLIDPITAEMIHTMGALFVDDTDLYTWREGILNYNSIPPLCSTSHKK
jgi:hypothetical protein